MGDTETEVDLAIIHTVLKETRSDVKEIKKAVKPLVEDVAANKASIRAIFTIIGLLVVIGGIVIGLLAK